MEGGDWRRALFVRKVVDSYVKVFYLDYGFADEDVPTLPKTLDEWMTRTKDPS